MEEESAICLGGRASHPKILSIVISLLYISAGYISFSGAGLFDGDKSPRIKIFSRIQRNIWSMMGFGSGMEEGKKSSPSPSLLLLLL